MLLESTLDIQDASMHSDVGPVIKFLQEPVAVALGFHPDLGLRHTLVISTVIKVTHVFHRRLTVM